MITLVESHFLNTDAQKTIVVSQWTSCLALVSSYLAEQGILHVKYANHAFTLFDRIVILVDDRYQGDMDRPKRDRAIKVFMSKEKARVMLMSLKCGGKRALNTILIRFLLRA